jgi:hypothetical protein
VILWPNIDAGADHISKSIRQFRVSHPDVPVRALTLPQGAGVRRLRGRQLQQFRARCRLFRNTGGARRVPAR